MQIVVPIRKGAIAGGGGGSDGRGAYLWVNGACIRVAPFLLKWPPPLPPTNRVVAFADNEGR